MILRFIKDRTGAAAAEMALVTPLLLVLMFGAFELGKYFWDNHVLAKAVRDGARYASRQAFANYNCNGNAIDGGAITRVQNLTRTSTVDGSGTVRLGGWTNANMTTVTLRCDTSGTYGAFYSGMAGVPVVRVAATVPYRSLFATMGFNAVGLNLVANSEVPVMGI